jgi:hypothetical protein
MSKETSTGEWKVVGNLIIDSAHERTVCKLYEYGPCGPAESLAQHHADAKLITEAGTVFHETGMTPRQLADRVKTVEREHACCAERRQP